MLEEYHLTIKNSVAALRDFSELLNDVCFSNKYKHFSDGMRELISINKGLVYCVANNLNYIDYEEYINLLYYDAGKVIIPRFASAVLYEESGSIKLYTPFSSYKKVTLRPLELKEQLSNKYYTVYEAEADINYKPIISTSGNYNMDFILSLSDNIVLRYNNNLLSIDSKYNKEHYTRSEYDSIKFLYEICAIHMRAFVIKSKNFYNIFYDMDNTFEKLYNLDIFEHSKLIKINDLFAEYCDSFIEDRKKISLMEQNINYQLTNLRMINEKI